MSACLAAVVSGYRLPYIIGGRDAQVGEFPWQVSMQCSGRHSCGASLVTTKWLITAAHCVGSAEQTIILGAHDIKTRIEGNPTEHTIEKKIKHADWFRNASIGLAPDDIALIKLKEPAVLDGRYIDTIRPAPADVGDLIDANCTITGWGRTQIGSTGSPNVLQAATTTAMSQLECQDGADSISSKIRITDGHICVGGQGDEGGCHGDSGGPLTCVLEVGSVVLAGEMSGGSSKCDTIYPSIYTRISHYRQWLSDNSDGEISMNI